MIDDLFRLIADRALASSSMGIEDVIKQLNLAMSMTDDWREQANLFLAIQHLEKARELVDLFIVFQE